MSKRRPIILSTEDRRILKALDPFGLLKPITFAPSNMVCGYKNLKLSWMFHTDAAVDLEVEEPFDISYQMALIQNFDICEASAHAITISDLMRRIVYPDLDITVLGKWYVPRSTGLLKSKDPWVMFGITGIYPVNAGSEGDKLEWPAVETPDGSRLLAVPREPLAEVLQWFRDYSPGQPQIMWLDVPGYEMPMCHIRGSLESADKTRLTTVYFLLSGIMDKGDENLGRLVGFL